MLCKKIFICIIKKKTMKTCTRCGQHKEEFEFSRNKINFDGYDNQCKLCFSQYIQMSWPKTIVRASRSNDNRDGRPTDDDNYIDEEFISNLILSNPFCHYCHVALAFGVGVDRSRHPRGLQIDRMDSILSHLKRNCVQSCRLCNQRCSKMPYNLKVLSMGGLLPY